MTDLCGSFNLVVSLKDMICFNMFIYLNTYKQSDLLVAIAILCVSSVLASDKKTDLKDKREAPVGYLSSAHSSHGYQVPSLGGHEDASAISVGAGYSVGGHKGQLFTAGPGLEQGQVHHYSGENLPSSGHATIQLAPVTLQPNFNGLVSNDLNSLMKQISKSLNSGSLQFQAPQDFGGSYSAGAQSSHGAPQELSLPQYTFAAPKYQQQYALSEPQASVPSYAAGTKGLGSYSSTGPVLFNPSESQQSGNQQSHVLTYASAPSSGQAYSNEASVPGPISYTSGGHSLGGLSLGSGPISFGSSNGLSLGSGSGHGHVGHYKAVPVPTKTSFKPSTFVGASVQSDSAHGAPSLPSSFSAQSLSGSHGLSGGHGGLSLGSGSFGSSFGGSLGGYGGGSSKFVVPQYSKHEGFGSSLESVASFAPNSHLSSSSGIPASFGSLPNSIHAASSHSPLYTSKHSSSSFGEGSSAYRAPSSGHSYSSGPKFSFSHSHAPGPRYVPKDIHGSASETVYNTIKYSEELKPYVHH